MFAIPFFFAFGAEIGYPWHWALICLGLGLFFAIAFYFVWIIVEKFQKPFSFENPKAQAKLTEYEASRGMPYEQMFCAYMHYGEGLKQEVCETRVYFETEGIHTAFCHFGKIYHFDIPYSAVVHMSLEDETILIIQLTDVAPLYVPIKETTPEKLAWLTEKAISIL